jgi:hypothetical protein
MNQRVELSTFYSDDMNLKAIVYHNRETKHFEVDYIKNDLIIATESYKGHSEQYHEDAAENYVIGIKTIV